MATQNYTWPAVSVTATNPSVGTNGSIAPTSSTEVGGIGLDGNLHAISTDNSGNQNVNVVSSALPSGSATAANQVLEITQLTGIHSDTTSLDSKTVHVDTGAVVVASSALPSGAASASNQSTEIASLGFIVTSSQQSANNTASLNLTPGASTAGSTGPLVLGAATTAAPSYSTGQVNPLSLDLAGSLRVTATASALPAGASTSALQTTGNTSLASIDTKTPALGQALAAASTPVVLTAAQLTSLTTLPAGASVSQVDATAFTLGGGSINPVGAFYSNAPDSVPNNAIGSVRMTQTRSLWTNIRDVTGNYSADVLATGELKTTVNNISGTVSLPTGASTAVNQTNGTQKSQIATPTALTITQAALTVGTSAVRLTVSGSAPAATRVVLVATPDSTATGKFYIGSSSVTATGATRGVQIAAGQVFTANSDAGDYWIVSDTAAQIVEVMEQA